MAKFGSRWPRSTAGFGGGAVVVGIGCLVALVGGGVWLGHGALVGWINVGVAVALVPLVGLAVEGSDDIARLTQAVERLADGEDDVDLSTDREDSVGDLYAAVERLAERASGDEPDAERYRKELYRITSDPTLDDEEKLDRVLELGCERLGVECGVVTDIDTDSGRYEVTRAAGSDFVTAGTVTDLSKTFCRKTVEADDVLAIFDVMAEGYAEDPAYTEWHISCYIGGKVEVDGDLRGTLCFVDRDGREKPFSHAERAFVDLASRWVSSVTERQRRTKELRRKNRALAEAPVGVTITGPPEEDVSIRYANAAFEELTGYDTADARGRNCRFLQGERTDPAPVTKLREAIQAGEATTVELRNYRKTGTEFWNRVSIAPIDDEDDDVVGYVGFQEDVTERIEREQELERYREFTDDMLDAVEDVVYVLDREGSLVRWNESFSAVTGYADEEIETMHALDFFDADDKTAIAAAIEEVFETGDTRVEVPYLTSDGASVLHEFVATRVEDPDGATMLAGIGRDITERREREQELERTKNLLEQAQRIAAVGGWELRIEDGDPTDETWSDQLYDILGVPREEPASLSTALDSFHPDDRATVMEMVGRAIENGDSFDMEARLRTDDGGERWIRSIGEPVFEGGESANASGKHPRADGEVALVRGSIQDITEHKERELALQALHETTRDLLTTATRGDVAGLVIDAAADVLDVPDVGIYLLDQETNELTPTAATQGFADRCDGDPDAAVGDTGSLLWETFVTGTGTVIGDSSTLAASTTFTGAESGVLVPIGDHGVFVALSAADAVDGTTRQLIETLVATTAAALDRIESEEQLRQRDAELEARNRRLRRQIQLTDIIRSVDQSLIGATTQEDIETRVCDRLVASEPVTGAWVGGVGDDGSVDPRAWAGDVDGYLDALDDAGDEPALAAARTGEPVVVQNVTDDLGGTAWRKQALARGLHAVVAVPITDGNFRYGVLAVYADEPGAFGDLERTVFAELGESIANAVTAAKTRAALHSETFVELRLRVDGSGDVIERIARETGCTVTYEGLATRTGDETRLFVSTAGPDSSAVRTALANLVSVVDSRLVSEAGNRTLFEITVSGETLVTRLRRHGGSVETLRADADGVKAVVALPTSTDVREYLGTVRDHVPAVELVAQRHVQRPTETEQETVSRLLAELTERQREVLKTAYLAGFFEQPRETTGQQLADILDVSQPTVNRHLRLAQQRLMAALFEREPDATETD